MSLEDKISKMKDELKYVKKEYTRFDGVAAEEKATTVKLKLSAEVVSLLVCRLLHLEGEGRLDEGG